MHIYLNRRRRGRTVLASVVVWSVRGAAPSGKAVALSSVQLLIPHFYRWTPAVVLVEP